MVPCYTLRTSALNHSQFSWGYWVLLLYDQKAWISDCWCAILSHVSDLAQRHKSVAYFGKLNTFLKLKPYLTNPFLRWECE